MRFLVIVLAMGVTGAGKTTVGKLLAQQLGWDFADADSFHSPENVEKIRLGIPLDDADRAPWLGSLRAAMEHLVAEHRNVVLACSALKKGYRDQLHVGSQVKLVYLKGSYDLIYKRLRHRQGHFAKEPLLTSQFADLEEPDNAIIVDIDNSPEEIVAEIKRRLGLRNGVTQ